MTPTTDQFATLRAAAAAATPGPWEHQTSNGWHRVGTTAANRGRVDGDVVANGAASPANMAYIATANPAAVLALLDHIDAQAAELAQAHEARREAQLREQQANEARNRIAVEIRRELNMRLSVAERDAARYRVLRDGMLPNDLCALGESAIMTALEALGDRVCDELGPDAIPTAAEFDAAIDAAMEQNQSPNCG
ncbi:ead/Ea22-like family protein [Chromobacterium piscinae]|uniref:ead/Ea22-like family protein n=1 Tax=Chromobacterium piscinae TaxID=686831 RepID=UPI0032084A51